MQHLVDLTPQENSTVNSQSYQRKYGPMVTVVEAAAVDTTDLEESVTTFSEKLLELRTEKVEIAQKLSVARNHLIQVNDCRRKWEETNNKVRRTTEEEAFLASFTQGKLYSQNRLLDSTLECYEASAGQLQEARESVDFWEQARNMVMSELATYTDKKVKAEEKLVDAKSKNKAVSYSLPYFFNKYF